MVSVLVACNKGKNHTHTYADAWSSDATHHWKGATCEHTEEKLAFSPHLLDGGKEVDGETVYTCTTCAYTRTASSFADDPLSVSLTKSLAPAGVTVLVEVFFKGQARDVYLLGVVTTDVAEVPGLVAVACSAFLALGVTQDKSELPSIVFQPGERACVGREAVDTV